MNKYMRNRRPRLGPRPGDFPLGFWESRAAARAVQLALDLDAQEQQAALFGNLTSFEQACVEISDDPLEQRIIRDTVGYCVVPTYELYGMTLPTPEHMRHNAQVAKEVAKIKQERTALGDTAFLDEKALREMAEDRVRRGSPGRAQTGSMTAEVAAKKK